VQKRFRSFGVRPAYGLVVVGIASIFFAISGSALGAGKTAEEKFLFRSPAVLFLGTNSPATAQPPDLPVRHETLSPEAAKTIVSAPSHSWESPGMLSAGAPVEDEKTLISREGRSVRRTGKTLTVTPSAAEPVVFKNWSAPAGPGREGDGAAYSYAGRFGRHRYYRVDDSLQHDAPGSYFISPTSGKTAYVHHGGDISALSPDGDLLVVFNPLNLNPKHALTVAALGPDGLSVELRCIFTKFNSRAEMAFKGWQGPKTFAVVLSRRAAADALPVRMERAGQSWVVAAPDRAALEQDFGFVCGR
jgi:hypothetical protein